MRSTKYHIYSGNEPVTASYHACSGNNSGKAGELSMKSLYSALRLRLTFATQIGNESCEAGELSYLFSVLSLTASLVSLCKAW